MAMGIAALFELWSRVIQHRASIIVSDAAEYYRMARQMAAGAAPSAEVPYAYRLGVPWLVSRLSPADPMAGFFAINVASGVLTAALLSLWLRHGVERLAVRLGLVTCFAAAWHGPVRYVHYNNGYVDPLYLVCVILALAAIESLNHHESRMTLAVLTALSMAGTFVRETMILLPVSAMVAAGPAVRAGASWRAALRPWSRMWPVVAAAAAIATTHLVVTAEPERSFVGAAAQWVRKGPSAYVLAWFTAYGPVLAVLLFDWRNVGRDLGVRRHLAAYLGLCAVLALVGGSDTERFLFWAMPVVYLLIGRAVERRLPVMRGPLVAGALLVAQAVSARVFWAIPDTRVDPEALGQSAGLGARAYGFLDRLLVIEHFHWNLWSSFGSEPFRLLRLAMYVAVTALLLWAMARRAREIQAA